MMKNLVRSFVSLTLIGALVVPAVASAAPTQVPLEAIDLSLPKHTVADQAQSDAQAATRSHGLSASDKGVLIGVAAIGGVVVTAVVVRALFNSLQHLSVGTPSMIG